MNPDKGGRRAVVHQDGKSDETPTTNRAPRRPRQRTPPRELPDEPDILDQPPLSLLSKKRSEMEGLLEDDLLTVKLVVVRLSDDCDPDFLARRRIADLHPERIAINYLPSFSVDDSKQTMLGEIDSFLQSRMGLLMSKAYELAPVDTQEREGHGNEVFLRYLVSIVNPGATPKKSTSSDYDVAQWVSNADAQSVEGSGRIDKIFYDLFTSASTGRGAESRVFNLVEQLSMVKLSVMSAEDAEAEDDEVEPAGRVRFTADADAIAASLEAAIIE